MSTNINISDLVRKIANSSADDLPTLAELQSNLLEMKGAIPTVNHPELGFMLDAAADLMRYLADGQQPSPQAMLTMLTRLLVNAECTMYRNLEILAGNEEEKAVGGALPAEGATPPHTLKLDAEAAVRPEGNDMSNVRLGQFLVQMGLVSAEQVTEAMEVQQREKVRLGEALALLGHVMPSDLKDALTLRGKMQTYAAEHEGESPTALKPQVEMNEWQNSLLGTVLVSNNVITREELEQGLAIQKATGMRLGEALVQHGLCDWPQVLSGIQSQERLRHVAKPVAGRVLSLSTTPAPAMPRQTPPSRIPPPPV